MQHINQVYDLLNVLAEYESRMRRSGRTTSIIHNLTEGDIVFFYSIGELNYFKENLSKLRPNLNDKNIRLFVFSNFNDIKEKILGIRGINVYFDNNLITKLCSLSLINVLDELRMIKIVTH